MASGVYMHIRVYPHTHTHILVPMEVISRNRAADQCAPGLKIEMGGMAFLKYLEKYLGIIIYL